MEGSLYNKCILIVIVVAVLHLKNVNIKLVETEIPYPVITSSKLYRDAGLGRCSALLRLLPNNSDLLAAHDTWNRS